MRSAARSTTDCPKTLVSSALVASKRGIRSSQPVNGPSTGCCRPPKSSATGSKVTLFTRTPTLTSVRSKQRWQLERPDGVRPIDPGPRRGDNVLRGTLDDLAALDPYRRLREEPGHLVPEAQRVSAGTGGDGAPTAVADAALDLEEIGEVRPAEKPQLAANRLGRGVEDRDLLERAVAHAPQATNGEAVGTEAGVSGLVRKKAAES